MHSVKIIKPRRDFWVHYILIREVATCKAALVPYRPTPSARPHIRGIRGNDRHCRHSLAPRTPVQLVAKRVFSCLFPGCICQQEISKKEIKHLRDISWMVTGTSGLSNAVSHLINNPNNIYYQNIFRIQYICKPCQVSNI